MSELGALLEVIHDAHNRLSTLVAEYQDWVRPQATLEMTVDRVGLEGAHLQWRGGGPFPRAAVSTRRIWSKRPNCLRVEVRRNNTLTLLAVLKEGQWWRWGQNEGAVTAEARSDGRAELALPPLLTPALLEPARLLATFSLKPAGYGWRAGRDVVCADALARDSSSPGVAQKYELEFDIEHGTMLRWAALEEGTLVRVTEAISIAYHVRIAPERFEFVAPDGSPVRPFRSGPMASKLAAAVGTKN